MCGIVAVAGLRRADKFLLDGLRRLEYRGYDSAGLSVLSDAGELSTVRAAGKVSALSNKLEALDAPLDGETGIAHTRWATHGAPVERNAHPHRAGAVALVHNGIIENYLALKRELEAEGRSFASDTDSEVVAQLFDRERARHADDLHAAWRAAVDRLEGAFALAALCADAPGRVFGARRSAPLLAATGKGLAFLASDLLALADRPERVIYLEEGDTVEISEAGVEIRDCGGAKVERAAKTAAIASGRADKGPYRHFMEKEISEQPEVIARTVSAYADLGARAFRLPEAIDFERINRLLIVACGTAAYAGEVSRYWFETLAGLPVQVDIASEFRYRDPAFAPGDAALFISQSGETADTLEALRLCKRAGLTTIALVNTPHSTMTREADIVLPTLAGPEIGVASTKAFTCQLAALAATAAAAARQRGRLDEAAQQALFDDLYAAPRLAGTALGLRADIDRVAQDLSRSRTVLYLGRHILFPMALEGALKLKEISYIHAEGYAAGELKHGPIALIEESVKVIVLAPGGSLFEKTRSSIQQVRARGGQVIALTDEAGAAELAGETGTVLTVPAAGRLSLPIVYAVAVQLLAYLTAVHKGTDVDQPRNLAKSVTVE